MIFLRNTILAILFISFQASLLHADTQTDKDTVLKLGMEMSNMRNMLEAFILIGAKVKYKNPTKKLKEGIVHYENMIDTIHHNYLNDEVIQQSIMTSRKAWPIVKGAMQLALQNEPLEKLKKGAIFIHGNIRTVIKEMAHMKNHIFKVSSIQDKEALNASIEIAASARRLSAHYMMDLWHLDDPTIEKHWKKGMKIYGDSMNTLQTSAYMKNPRFATLFRSVKKYHRYFEKMWEKPKIFSILIDKKADIAFRQAKEMTQIILQTK